MISRRAPIDARQCANVYGRPKPRPRARHDDRRRHGADRPTPTATPPWPARCKDRTTRVEPDIAHGARPSTPARRSCRNRRPRHGRPRRRRRLSLEEVARSRCHTYSTSVVQRIADNRIMVEMQRGEPERQGPVRIRLILSHAERRKVAQCEWAPTKTAGNRPSAPVEAPRARPACRASILRELLRPTSSCELTRTFAS